MRGENVKFPLCVLKYRIYTYTYKYTHETGEQNQLTMCLCCCKGQVDSVKKIKRSK